MSVEQACRAVPVSQAERAESDAVLVLAKLPMYFHLRGFEEALGALSRVRDAIAPTKLWTTAYDDQAEYPLPEALTSLGVQSPEAYGCLLGRAKVLLGVGSPVISPTPYEAL
jgi:alpha-1,3(6)-mannosylglycoprotein beta-1,6-N-acetyl-glucosaminyltransferase